MVYQIGFNSFPLKSNQTQNEAEAKTPGPRKEENVSNLNGKTAMRHVTSLCSAERHGHSTAQHLCELCCSSLSIWDHNFCKYFFSWPQSWPELLLCRGASEARNREAEKCNKLWKKFDLWCNQIFKVDVSNSSCEWELEFARCVN